MAIFRSPKTLAALVVGGTFMSAQPGEATVFFYEKENLKAFFSGYAGLDVISDSTRGIEEIVGSSPVARPGTVAGDNGRIVYSSRVSRLSLGIITSRGSTKIKGMIEADFLGYEPAVGNGVSESGFYQNPTLRLRHAYFLAENQGWSILAGQYWTLFGWQSDYLPRTVSLPPMTGTVFARTPQITGFKTFGSPDETNVTIALSSSRPVQREAEVPNFDAGFKVNFGQRRGPLALTNGDTKLYSMSLAVTGTTRQLSHPAKSISKNISLHKRVQAYAVDVMVPVIAATSDQDMSHALTFAGEYTRGSGYGDLFPRWNGNLANPSSAAPGTAGPFQEPYVDAGVEGYSLSENKLTPVELTSWNASLQYHLPQGFDTWTTVGMGELLSKNAKELKPAASAVIYDRQRGAFGNIVHNFSPEIRAGIEYALMQTRYVDQVSAQNHRVQLTTWYRF